MLRSFVMVLGTVFLAQTATAQISVAEIESTIERHVRANQIPGLGVVLIKGGRFVYEKGFGFEDRESGIPVSPHTTRFRWASIAKTMTAVAAVKANSDGFVNLDSFIGRYYEGYGAPQYYFVRDDLNLLSTSRAHGITLRRLLSHTAGMQHYNNGQGSPTPPRSFRNSPVQNTGMRWALEYWQGHYLVSLPGQSYNYSTPGFNLAGVTLEEALNTSFPAIIAHYVAQPADMTTLRPDYGWDPEPARAVGYRREDGNLVRDGDNDVSWKLAGGGFVSSVRDLGRYAQALMGDSLLSRSEKDQLWTRSTLNNGESINYGLGFGVRNTARGLRISHSGSQEKARTLLVLYPDEGTAVALMSNASFNVDLDGLGSELVGLMR